MFDKFALLGFGPGGWGWALLQGAANTISVALATLPFGLALGLVIALWKRSDSVILRALATTYTTVFRGVPELLTLYIIYFGIQVLVQKVWTGFSIPPFVASCCLRCASCLSSAAGWRRTPSSIWSGRRRWPICRCRPAGNYSRTNRQARSAINSICGR